MEEGMAEPRPEAWKKVSQVKRKVSVVVTVLTLVSNAFLL